MRLLKIGRDTSCDIVLYSDKVSSLHAEITLMNSGDIMLEDKGSSNGTFIQNQAIKPGKPVKIRRGDAIRFGDVELQWSQVPMPEDNSAYKAIYGVGSHFNNDIQVSGGTVSRYHATIKVGKDGKVYIIDHSKNGTTVDGQKITPNNPYRIKKSSAIVCGGVPLNHKTAPIQWPSEIWKTILSAAAVILIVAGVGFGIYELTKGSSNEYEDGELYAMYNNSVVYLEGTYHFHVTGIPEEKLKQYGLPVNFFVYQEKIYTMEQVDLSIMPYYSGTGFFVSNDGKMITNLHVVKPWLWGNIIETAEAIFKQHFARVLSIQDYKTKGVYGALTGDAAYISQIKVEGVLDKLLFVPQGKYYSVENAVSCRVLSAGDNVDEDVALIQSEKGELPNGARYINVVDSMDVDNKALKVGQHVYTIGFPKGQNSLLQKKDNEKGIQVIAQGGSIIQQDSEYEFGYNAPTTSGASGSPIFNKFGMLVGVHHAGLSQTDAQGYNYGVKAKLIKQIIESPHKK
ncbi:MAG: FHA domain-containing protein [Prevotella sp.]|nr:FHA domain-containing protein [Prevotella sp.]